MKQNYLTPLMEVIQMQMFEVICGGASAEDLSPNPGLGGYDDDSD